MAKLTQMQILRTEDGSPTVQSTYDSGVSEKMHHFRGAFSETLYIYGPAVDFALTGGRPPRFLSVGLGLAYNEMMIAAKTLSCAELDLRSIRIDSYEISDELKDSLRAWLANQDLAQQDFPRAYQEIAERMAKEFSVTVAAIKDLLKVWLAQGQWQLRGAFVPGQSKSERYTAILYDAFSAKMDPELWSEAGLEQIIADVCLPDCVWSTYAATGALKRALRSQNFTLQDKVGFGGKKESTFAVRQA